MSDFISAMMRFFLGIAVIVILYSVFFGETENQTMEVETESNVAVSETPTTEPDHQPLILKPEVEQPTSYWIYESEFDEMRGETSYFATSPSLNTVQLDFPHQGGTRLSIILRKHANLGNDIAFAVNKGMLHCNYRDCYVSIKFDDEGVQKYETTEAAAGAHDVLFLSNDISGFVNKLKKSEKVMVEVNFYDRGAEQFTFDVTGLEWSHF